VGIAPWWWLTIEPVRGLRRRRGQRERVDPGQLRALGQGRDRDVARRIAVAYDIEAA
jgi:hypothetical protein